MQTFFFDLSSSSCFEFTNPFKFRRLQRILFPIIVRDQVIFGSDSYSTLLRLRLALLKIVVFELGVSTIRDWILFNLQSLFFLLGSVLNSKPSFRRQMTISLSFWSQAAVYVPGEADNSINLSSRDVFGSSFSGKKLRNEQKTILIRFFFER